MMTPIRSSTVLALLVWAAPVLAQSPSEGPVIDWLVKNEISVRKTFDGKSKDESEPAKVSYNAPNSAEPFWLVDLTVKVSEWDICANCTGKSILVYPVFEWHRSTSAVEELHKVKVGPAIDFHWGDLTQRTVGLIALLKANYERDALKDVSSGNFTALGGVMGANRKGGGNTWLPMSHINDGNGNLVFRYAPFAGFERYGNLAIESKDAPTIPKGALTVFAFHIQSDFYPLNTRSSPGWFEITASVAWRRKIAGHEDVEDNLPLASVSANVYFDRARHFAIGADYETGRSPMSDFDDQRSTSVGFKAKF